MTPDDPMDDPRLTAHAMGEESGPLTPEEQAEVEAIRATAETLKAGFAATPMPVLDEAHRNAILQGLSPEAAKPVPGTVPGSAVKLSDYSGLGALAATLLLVVGFGIAGATGGGSRGGDGIYVRSSSAPTYCGSYLDEDLQLVLSEPSRGSTITVDRFVGSGGAGGAAGGVQPTTRQFTFTPGYGYGIGGGGGGPSAGSGTASAGTFYNRFGDGDYRGRAEIIVGDTAQRPPNVAPSGTPPPDLDVKEKLRFANGPPKEYRQRLEEAFRADEDASTESTAPFIENPWIRPYGEAALSTFSIDVDTAGYSIVRRCLLEQNRLPPPGALRVEELVNYFPYSYAGPVTADPFAVHVDAAACPWEPSHRLVRIALKGREVEEAVRPAANLVFLLDVSGSMAQPNKLPLVQKSIAMLTERLTARDRVAMVVYAGQSGLVLPSTPAGAPAPILEALGRLQAGGSTNGGAGIELAYKVAQENFVPGGINRVVLATDGDFNVGVSDPSALVKMVEEKAKSGVFLTALGYGMDNLKDSTLEQLADRGNGNYGYVDNLSEARKVLVEQGMSTLHCIAKDVKIQVEFNPAKVAGYRLLGYENRMLAAQDFADDAKDAGEIGAGHTVTALYEVVPAGGEVPGAPVDELRFQRPGAYSGAAETLVVKLRWKEPEGTVSTPREFPFVDAGLSFESGSEDFRFAAAAAAFGMVLRDSKCAGSANLDLVREIAAGALGADPGGYRAEFLSLVEKAKTLKR